MKYVSIYYIYVIEERRRRHKFRNVSTSLFCFTVILLFMYFVKTLSIYCEMTHPHQFAMIRFLWKIFYLHQNKTAWYAFQTNIKPLILLNSSPELRKRLKHYKCISPPCKFHLLTLLNFRRYLMWIHLVSCSLRILIPRLDGWS